jgi:hypothetical protein
MVGARSGIVRDYRVIPTRVGGSAFGDSLAGIALRQDIAWPQKSRAIAARRADALKAALGKATLPLAAEAGGITVTILEFKAFDDISVRIRCAATVDGKPLAGWDDDHVIVNPRVDFVDGASVREDPAMCALSALFDLAAGKARRPDARLAGLKVAQ